MWTPPSTITDHQGNRQPPDADFFVAPPPELGAIRSAYTSLKQTTRAKPLPIRVAITLAWGLAGFLLIFGFQMVSRLFLIPADLTGTSPILWVALLALFPTCWGWRYSAFRHFCTFAGAGGCAETWCEGERTRINRQTVFLFQDAGALSTGQTRLTKNGIYNGTTYFYAWYSPDRGRIVYQLKGEHFAEKRKPGPQDPYNFARAVEAAWYSYAGPRILSEFASRGFVKFYMGHQNSAILGSGFIDFVDPHGKTSRCLASDIGSVILNDGRLTIRRRDAQRSHFELFNHEGVFDFSYSGIHNAQIFLSLFEQALGIRIQ